VKVRAIETVCQHHWLVEQARNKPSVAHHMVTPSDHDELRKRIMKKRLNQILSYKAMAEDAE